MDATQTDRTSEAAPAPQEERTARHLRMLARAADVHMEIIEATRTEAVEAPQPGVDYGQRIAVVTRSLRLTLLLEAKLSRQAEEKRKAAAQREAAQEDWHGLRVNLAMMAAAYEVSGDGEEADRREAEMHERLERPEVVELIEASRPEVAVAALCRRWGYPVRVEQWLEMADEAMEELGFLRRRTARTPRIRPSRVPLPLPGASRRTPGRRDPSSCHCRA
ncbi:hypothetical protein [Inquilinus sp. Marseille-Q2685]|uniref:hypothetical protein n=1 Tax=Inquilinus sp. Marseille-Q2685 TaxID=2866581 RepID=UPI001CE3DC85|nr:hypothetical protein [Inquilinus sp. Marseille-Q2685]